MVTFSRLLDRPLHTGWLLNEQTRLGVLISTHGHGGLITYQVLRRCFHDWACLGLVAYWLWLPEPSHESRGRADGLTAGLPLLRPAPRAWTGAGEPEGVLTGPYISWAPPRGSVHVRDKIRSSQDDCKHATQWGPASRHDISLDFVS